MIYFDTDVLVNFHMPQNLEKYREANEMYRKASSQFAENYCDQLYTFNKADFKRIKAHTRLKITIL